MVDPAIKPEQHPLGHIAVGQKLFGFTDQIVEIKHSHGEFCSLIGGQKYLGKRTECAGFIGGIQRPFVVFRNRNTVHPTLEIVDKRLCGLNRLFVIALREISGLGPGAVRIQEHLAHRVVSGPIG